jgi:hypothetical protein
VDDWIDSLRGSLLLEEGLSAETIAHALQRPGSMDDRDMNLVRTLTRADPLYLTKWDINAIVSGELSETQVLERSRAYKDRCERIAALYPEIIRLFSKKTNFVLRYTAERLNDLTHDFSHPPLEGRRPDKVLRDKLRRGQKVKSTFKAALGELLSLSDSLPEFLTEFHQISWAIDSSDVSDSFDFPMNTLEVLQRQLGLVIIALDVIDFDLSSASPREFQRDNRLGKRDVVALAYDFHISCGGPPLVTTPGSEFSYLCSLLYELCTEKAGEGLAGAIIDFARGRQRREEDRYQEELKRDEEAYLEGDNFYIQRTGAESDFKSAEWYRDAAGKFRSTPDTALALLRVSESLLKRAAARQAQVGPFIVWADQLPLKGIEELHAEVRQREEELSELRRRVGELQRAALKFS